MGGWLISKMCKYQDRYCRLRNFAFAFNRIRSVTRTPLPLAVLPSTFIETNLSVMGLEVRLKNIQSCACLLSQDVKEKALLHYSSQKNSFFLQNWLSIFHIRTLFSLLPSLPYKVTNIFISLLLAISSSIHRQMLLFSCSLNI